jgi:hypothetical protein
MRVVSGIVRQVTWMVVVLSLAFPASARADDGSRSALTQPASSGEQHGHFFGYAAPLTASAAADIFGGPPLSNDGRLVHVGGGGEATIGRIFGIGTDFGGIHNAARGGTAAVLSVNGYAHARGSKRASIDPYLTAGYSGVVFVHQRSGGPNLGAGVNWWSRRSLGLAVELRQTYGVTFRELRVGVVLRQ